MNLGVKLTALCLAAVLALSPALAQWQESPEERQRESLAQITQPLVEQQRGSMAQITRPLVEQQIQSMALNTSYLEEQQRQIIAVNTSYMEEQQRQSLAVNQTYNGSPSDYNISLAYNATFGQYLVDSRGMTLYYLANDTMNVSTCYGQCAENWPPFYSSIQDDPSRPGTSDFSTITRRDGDLQTVYRGRPLYYFARDMMPGDIRGHGIGGAWFVAGPGEIGT